MKPKNDDKNIIRQVKWQAEKEGSQTPLNGAVRKYRRINYSSIRSIICHKASNINLVVLFHNSLINDNYNILLSPVMEAFI